MDSLRNCPRIAGTDPPSAPGADPTGEDVDEPNRRASEGADQPGSRRCCFCSRHTAIKEETETPWTPHHLLRLQQAWPHCETLHGVLAMWTMELSSLIRFQKTSDWGPPLRCRRCSQISLLVVRSLFLSKYSHHARALIDTGCSKSVTRDSFEPRHHESALWFMVAMMDRRQQHCNRSNRVGEGY